MRQKKVKQLRREFRKAGRNEKEYVTEKKKRIKFEGGKIVEEEYDDVKTINHFRKFKKERGIKLNFID